MSHPDRHMPRKGRGAASNPANRFDKTQSLAEDDGWGSLDEPLPELETIVRAETARTIISRNASPDIPFTQSINPYRGCEHGCPYCLDGDTPILYADGRHRPIKDAGVGDVIIGTVRDGSYRRYVETQITHHWTTLKPAYRIELADGTELVTSGDHRFLTERGWKFVTGAGSGRGSRPHLTLNNRLLGTGAIARKRSIAGIHLKSEVDLSVLAIEPLGEARRMYDITTGTGDFIADGVVSHNCYARPSHGYAGLSPGLDFETRLFYKADAARLLEKELGAKGYACSPIALGTNTDPYQPIERRYRVTRHVLELLSACDHPATIVTKGAALIGRDMDLLADMARRRLVAVFISITTLDAKLKRTLEPRAASPSARLEAIRCLSGGGVPVGVMVAPVIPALTDHELERILEAAAEAGARTAGYVMLRLPYEVAGLFREWLETHEPLKAKHVMSRVGALRAGRDNDPQFGTRMRGTGTYARLFERRFALARRKLGLAENDAGFDLDTSRFRPPEPTSPQQNLF